MPQTGRYWSIRRDKKKVVVSYGKLGGKMTTRDTGFADPNQAASHFQQQIAQKLRAGYRETTADDAPEADATLRALEAALAEDPDELAAHMAYADYLSEQPDPRHQARGEFVRIQLQLEDANLPAAHRKKLARREKELLAAHERRWMGWRFYDALLDGGTGTLWAHVPDKPEEARTYRRGWIDRLEVPTMSRAAAAAMVASPVVRLVRELVLDDGTSAEEVSATFVGHPSLANVRVLRVLEFPDERSLAPLVAGMKRLEVLETRAYALDLGDLFSSKTLGRLRELHAEDCEGYDVVALAKNASLTNLRKLALLPDLADQSEGPHICLADVRALARSKHLRSLESLTLHRTDAGDDGIDALIAGGLIGRLAELDLSNGCITDRGALALAAAPGYRNLQRLTLTYNRLSRTGKEALKRPGLKLDVKDQQIEGEGYDEDYLYDDWDMDSDLFDEDFE